MLKKILVAISLVILPACQSLTPPIGEVVKDPMKFDGKDITVRGYTYSGTSNAFAFGKYVGHIGVGEKGGFEISCYFEKKDADEFSNIKGAQFITVRGVVSGANAMLDSCTLVKIEPETVYPVKFVDRTAVFSPDNRPNPLLLVVGITEDGKLTINQTDAGENFEFELLAKKLKAIFEERSKASVSEREIVIEPKAKIHTARINRLIETLAEDVKASQILIIKNNSQ